MELRELPALCERSERPARAGIMKAFAIAREQKDRATARVIVIEALDGSLDVLKALLFWNFLRTNCWHELDSGNIEPFLKRVALCGFKTESSG